ncbi:hypothetical protein [Chryseobacterium sp. LAM-KRS1]|uniref:hypothetical protein n=1 Tax=Chryseobacterium sp. LAM-KRS1 TaxID=2715754 RepID=UPI001555B704|nr:hypothetical protein [Chryseobacterium sp. LAM-KRS1]
MKNTICCLLILCFLSGCKSFTKQDLQSSCGNTFEVQYIENGKYKLSKQERAKDYLTIYFLEEFNDQIKISINQKEVFNKKVITDTTKFDTYSAAFTYKISSTDTNYVIKGYSERNKTCFEVPINTKYRIIYLYYHNEKWIVRFSNGLIVN